MEILAHEIDTTGEQVLHGGGTAAIGYMGDRGAHNSVEQHGADMQPGARTGRAELHVRLVGPRVGDEIRQRVYWQVFARNQDARGIPRRGKSAQNR